MLERVSNSFPCPTLLPQDQTALTTHNIMLPLVREYAYDWRSPACFPKENAAMVLYSSPIAPIRSK